MRISRKEAFIYLNSIDTWMENTNENHCFALKTFKASLNHSTSSSYNGLL